MDDKLKQRLAGAAVLLVATFVAVSLLPTPEQAAHSGGNDVVTIPLHEVLSSAPPPPSATSTPPTIAAPPAMGDGAAADEVDVAGDDDGSGDSAEARKPVQLAMEGSLKHAPGDAAGPAPKPVAPPAGPANATPDGDASAPPSAAAKPVDKPVQKPAAPAAEKPLEKPAEKPAAKAIDRPLDKPALKAPEPSVAKPAPPPASGSWSVQVGGFADIGNARQVQDRLKTLGQASFLSPIGTAKGTLYRVRAGPYANAEQARAALGKLNANGYPDARLVGP